MGNLDRPIYWTANLTEDRRQALEYELSRELPMGHVLESRRCRAKAVGGDGDDVVFQLEDGSFAAVHLTWEVESDAQWPFTLLFDNLKSLGESEEWG
jgi:hypothetical protein